MKIPKVSHKIAHYPLKGGEDLVTSAIDVDPGRLSFSQNYECDFKGRYRAIDGYEVFDGHPKPSDASYWILNFDTVLTMEDEEIIFLEDGDFLEIEAAGTMAVGDTVTGEDSAATGEILAVMDDGIDQHLSLIGVSGTFQDGENLQISGSNVATVDGGVLYEQEAPTTALHDTYIQAAIEAARSDISAVSGSGDVLGVWQYNGIKYAFRNNAAGTAAKMFKSSETGWAECDLGSVVSFTSGGTYEVSEDDIVEGETGGATATVKRIIVTSGSWAAGTAAGRFVLYSQTGNFQSETLKVGANLNVATIAGNSTATTLSPDGSFDFVNHNFYGHTKLRRMYGCDGKNTAFEWDGSTFVPIITGMTTDTPVHISTYRQHLFLAFPGGSLQHSSTGIPYDWSPITGAAELAIGDEITKISVVPGPILVAFARNSTWLLYGSSVADWDLREHSSKSGCIEWSAQQVGMEIYLDDRGLTTLSNTDAYGDVVGNIISKDIQPYLHTKIGNVQSSIVVKDKGQYRLFFNDMQGLNLTLDGNKIIGYTRLFYDVLPVCCCSSENSSGEEELFFGSTDGFVYQLDSGTSFNGNEIEHLLRLHYNHLKTPLNEKQIRKLILELDAPIGTELKYFIDFSYGDDAESEVNNFDVSEGGGIWGVSDWDEFVWDGPSVGTAKAYPEGSGINFCLILVSESIYVEPHTIQGLIAHYSIRGLRR